MKKQRNSAGRYVKQLKGYRAFIPELLPPTPPIRMDQLYGLLSQADRALGRLDGSVLTLPNPDLFVFMYVRKEAVFSASLWPLVRVILSASCPATSMSRMTRSWMIS